MSIRDLMESYGYGPATQLPEIAGTYKGKRLIVCGDAINVWTDLECFGARDDSGRGKVRKDGWDILTVNKLIETFPGNVEHIYSNASRVLRVALAARRDEYTREFRPCEEIHTHSITEGVRWRWPWAGYGTSGLGAILVGLALGYDRIVLCGMPLNDGPHNGEPPWRRTAFATSEAAGSERDDRDTHWKRAITHAFGNAVRSMSGRTKTWVGDALPWK